MNRYKKYKDSGVEWIGEIPRHWTCGSMKYVLENNDGGVWGDDIEDDQTGVIVIRSTEITIDGKWDLSNPMKRKLSDKDIAKCLLKQGDIIITKSSGSPDHIGKSVIVDKYVEDLNCCYSNFVQRIRFNGFNPKLYHYILNSQIVREQFRYLTQSTTGLGNLNGTNLNEVILPFIPLSEQEQIVSYLDEKTSQIDKMIQITETKIDLLKQKRVSLINEAVTKGLDKTVKMKDSGVEWIGEIPRHWVMIKLKCISYINNGSTPNSGISEFWDGDIVWVTPSDISRLKNRIIQNSERKITPSGLNSCGTNIVPPNSVILTTRAPIGNIGISSIELCTNQGCKSIVTQDINPVLLYYFLLISKEELQALGSGTTFLELSTESLKNFQVVLPPLSEQEQIVSFLDEKTSQIDQLVSIEQKRIETLKEYRQSLISEVVTGKVKVCDNEVA